MTQHRLGLLIILAASMAMGGQDGVGTPPEPGAPEGGARQWRGRMPRREHPGADGGDGLGSMLLGVLERSGPRTELGISEETVTTLKRALEAQRAELTALRERAKEAAMKQVQLLAADTVDEAAVMAVVEAVGAIRTEMAKIHVRQLLLIKQHLTPQQLEQIRQFIGKRRGRDGAMRKNDMRRLGPVADDNEAVNPGAVNHRRRVEKHGAAGEKPVGN